MAALGSDAPFHARAPYTAIATARQLDGIRKVFMNSKERHEARYRRRAAARAAKKAAALATADDFEAVFTYRNMHDAYRKSRHGVGWKASVQKYSHLAPLNICITQKRLMQGTYRSPGFHEFDLHERGKARHIRSTTINERVVQRCLCDNSLIPALTRTFIFDNGASLKDKGYDFAADRLERHLHEHYRQHGQEGYILLFDFSKFFDNVSHELVKKIVREELTDRRIIALTDHFIDMFGARGLGLGSQISQVLALTSANRLDHYIKEVLHIRGYGRYMDDGYLIHKDKRYLQRCLVRIRAVCNMLGITLNEKKTQIRKLSNFVWLKMRVSLLPSGRVLKRICKKSITRARRKLKSMFKLYSRGEIMLIDIHNSVQSFYAYADRFSAWHTKQSIRALYDKLLEEAEKCITLKSQTAAAS